jgi:hypothetical protein
VNSRVRFGPKADGKGVEKRAQMSSTEDLLEPIQSYDRLTVTSQGKVESVQAAREERRSGTGARMRKAVKLGTWPRRRACRRDRVQRLEPPDLREEVRERVLAAAQAMGYSAKPQGAAPARRQGQRHRRRRSRGRSTTSSRPLGAAADDRGGACLQRPGAGLALVSVAAGAHWPGASRARWWTGSCCAAGGRTCWWRSRSGGACPFVALSLDTEEPDVPGHRHRRLRRGAGCAAPDPRWGHRRIAILAIGSGRRARAGSPDEARPRASSTCAKRARATGPALGRGRDREEEVPSIAVDNERQRGPTRCELLFDGPAAAHRALAMSDRVAMAPRWLARERPAVPGRCRWWASTTCPEAEAAVRPSPPWRSPTADRGAVGRGDPRRRDARTGARSCPLSLVVRQSTGPSARQRMTISSARIMPSTSRACWSSRSRSR